MIPTRLVAAVLAVTPVVVLACGSGSSDKASGIAAAKLPKGADALAHEGCDESGNRVDVLDTNGDGKSDIRRVFDKKTGHELCRIVDLNHDGQPDLFEYFDTSGTLRRREYCYDDTGVVNAIEYYQGGKLAKREYDTGGQHRIDTWDYFDPGLPTDPKTGRPLHPSRRERDTTGAGHVDQWWTWDGNKVSIARDTTGDGKPDPASVIVLGGDDDAGAASAPAADGDGGAAASDASTAATDGGGSDDQGITMASGSGADAGAGSASSGDGGAPRAATKRGKR